MVDGRSDQKIQSEDDKRRKQRNLMIALMLGAFVVIVFLVTVLRLGASVADRTF